MNRSISLIFLAMFSVFVLLTFAYIRSNQLSANAVTNTTKLAPAPSFSAYQGKSIKILTAVNFFNEAQWQKVDNYTSHGYDIKSVIPFKDRFFIVLQKGSNSTSSR